MYIYIFLTSIHLIIDELDKTYTSSMWITDFISIIQKDTIHIFYLLCIAALSSAKFLAWTTLATALHIRVKEERKLAMTGNDRGKERAIKRTTPFCDLVLRSNFTIPNPTHTQKAKDKTGLEIHASQKFYSLVNPILEVKTHHSPC